MTINNLDGSTLGDNLMRAIKCKFQLKLLKMTKRAWSQEHLTAIRYVVSRHYFSNSFFLRNHIYAWIQYFVKILRSYKIL